MTITALKKQLESLKARIYKHRQYLKLYQKQLDCLYDATAPTARRTRGRMAELEALIITDGQKLEETTEALKTAIDAVADDRIQEILTRRYICDETFEAIADAMNYDLRWVYRLHRRGVGDQATRE